MIIMPFIVWDLILLWCVLQLHFPLRHLPSKMASSCLIFPAVIYLNKQFNLIFTPLPTICHHMVLNFSIFIRMSWNIPVQYHCFLLPFFLLPSPLIYFCIFYISHYFIFLLLTTFIAALLFNVLPFDTDCVAFHSHGPNPSFSMPVPFFPLRFTLWQWQ